MATVKRLGKSRYFSPYTGKRTNLLPYKGKAGVYIIRKGDTIVYIGYSESNIYKTCLRHFQSWDDKRQVRVFYKQLSDISVRVIITTPARAAKLERALILKHRPKDNPDKLKNYLITDGEEDLLEEYEAAPALSHNEMEKCPF